MMKQADESKFKGKALLRGRKCVVTGGALGIGSQISYTFAESEAEVVILDFNREAAEKAVAHIRSGTGNHKVHYVQGDVSVRKGLQKSFAEIASILNGSIDIFVNNVGIIQPCRIEDIISDREARLTEISEVVMLYALSTYLNGAAIPVSGGKTMRL